MKTLINFSAGPAILPKEVLEQVQRELLSYQGLGLSILEMSHRSMEFENLLLETQNLVKKLLNLGDDYQVLFLQGGASSQFAMVPLNLLSQEKKAAYILTGVWAEKAYKEGKKFGQMDIIASSKDDHYTYIPDTNLADKANPYDYVHFCSNNTIYGSRFRPDNLPKVGDVPLVADMSSNIMSEVYPYQDIDLIYAGAQKNLGPAGLTLVVIKKTLIKDSLSSCPTMFSYQTHSQKNSLYNTPPTFAIYVMNLVLGWLDNLGGIAAIESLNKEKANLLYNFIDNSKLYHNTIHPDDRSLMNVTFSCQSKELDDLFVKEAQAKGFINLKGHRDLGGLRASIYNAMPMESIKDLLEFMKQFELNHA